MSGMSAIGGMQTRSFEPPTFSKLDGDSSGEITLEELKSNAPGDVSRSEGDARTQKLFDALDADGSGGISEEEKSTFDAAQQDRMASLGFSAQVMGGRPPPPPPPSGEDVVGALDTDEDGGISFEEFSASNVVEDADSAAIEELFAAIDADSNGSISANEAESFLAENKPEGGPRGAGGPPPPPPPAEEDEDDDSYVVLDALSAAISAYESSSTSADALTSNLMDLLEGEA